MISKKTTKNTFPLDLTKTFYLKKISDKATMERSAQWVENDSGALLLLAYFLGAVWYVQKIDAY